MIHNLYDVTGILSNFISGLLSIDKRKYEKLDREIKLKDEKIHAINAVRLTAISTKSYIHNLRKFGQASREKEQELAENWQKVAELVHKYDRQLFDICNVKALGWASPDEWGKIEKTVSTVKLDDIIKQCDYHTRNMH